MYVVYIVTFNVYETIGVWYVCMICLYNEDDINVSLNVWHAYIEKRQ